MDPDKSTLLEASGSEYTLFHKIDISGFNRIIVNNRYPLRGKGNSSQEKNRHQLKNRTYVLKYLLDYLYFGEIFTQFAHKSGPLSAHQRKPLKWRLAGGPILARYCSLTGRVLFI